MAKFIEELAEDVGEVEAVVSETETDLSTVTDDSGRQQRDTEQAPKVKRPSLDDNPDFRKWKSEQDRRAAQLEKQLAETTRQRQEESQRMAWYEQQLEALQTQHLDEPSKLAFENNKLKRQMAAITQQQQIDEGRQRIFARITARFGPAGVPYEAYANAQDADEAWDLAADYALKALSPKQAAAANQARQEKREANSVDLGGGATVDTDTDRKLAKAFKDGDSQLYMKLLRQTRQQE